MLAIGTLSSADSELLIALANVDKVIVECCNFYTKKNSIFVDEFDLLMMLGFVLANFSNKIVPGNNTDLKLYWYNRQLNLCEFSAFDHFNTTECRLWQMITTFPNDASFSSRQKMFQWFRVAFSDLIEMGVDTGIYNC